MMHSWVGLIKIDRDVVPGRRQISGGAVEITRLRFRCYVIVKTVKKYAQFERVRITP